MEGGTKDKTVQSMAGDLRVRLYELMAEVNNVVDRTPSPECEVEQRVCANVFDDIILTLAQCKTLTEDISILVINGIAMKVH